MISGLYGKLALSSVYESRAVGFNGADFYNMVIGFDTDEEPSDVQRTLRVIETRQGRERVKRRFSNRTLDLDLLSYGKQVVDEPGLSLPRSEILEHAFVLAPLAQIAGEEVHPLANRTYGELWKAFDASDQVLRAVPGAFNANSPGTNAPGDG